MAQVLHVGTDWFTGTYRQVYVQAGLHVRTGWFTGMYRLVYMYVQAGLHVRTVWFTDTYRKVFQYNYVHVGLQICCFDSNSIKWVEQIMCDMLDS